MTRSSGPTSFDRATEYYDRTRALSDAAMSAVVRMLAAEVAHRQPCLEIGVGTGRIALPLARAGVRMAGIDVSHGMVAKLVDKAGGAPPFPLALADATRLPFADAVLGATLACHVLHLIARWRAAVAEAVRVVRPGGVVLVDLGGWGSGSMRRLHERFAAEAGLPARRAGVEEPREVDAAMEAHGASVRVLESIDDERRVTLRAAIADLEAGLYSNTWSAPPETRAQAAAEVRRWAEAELGGLDEVRTEVRTITWRAYDLPSSGC